MKDAGSRRLGVASCAGRAVLGSRVFALGLRARRPGGALTLRDAASRLQKRCARASFSVFVNQVSVMLSRIPDGGSLFRNSDGSSVHLRRRESIEGNDCCRRRRAISAKCWPTVGPMPSFAGVLGCLL
jgi:hypothetical protein